MTARIRFTPFALFLLAAIARADDSPLLGPRFGEANDVSFKPFVDAKTVDKKLGSEIARFENPAKHWALSFAKAELKVAQPLKDDRDASGAPTVGFLTAAVNQLRSGGGDVDVLRNEAIDLGDLPVGVLMAQVTDNHRPVLLQEAFIQINPKLYYSLAMTSPCPAKNIGDDPAVVEAGQTFKAIIDSIERVDLSAIRDDQDERLIRTRALFVNWNKKYLTNALQPEQFLLFKRDGKPVGYAYMVEQPADAVPKTGELEKGITVAPVAAAGLRIGIRTRLLGEAGKSSESESWMYVSFDRRHEVWSNFSVINNPAAMSEKDKKVWFSEVGASDMQRERVFEKNLKSDDFKDLDQKNRDDKTASLPFHEVDKYKLTARIENRNVMGEPIEKDLPPFYISQAIAVLLPHIVPLNNPTGYLFATYSADSREVMLRYLDVKPETDVKLNGKLLRAVPVVDKIGLQGEPTTHYMSAAGAYLGSVNESTKFEIEPADHDTILAAFKDANLTQPGAVQN